MHMLDELGLMHNAPGDETYISVAKHRMCSACYLTRGKGGEPYCRRSDFEIFASTRKEGVREEFHRHTHDHTYGDGGKGTTGWCIS
jgi:hypothetical protein